MKVLFVGDVHANTDFIDAVYKKAVADDIETIVQVGDFGWWPRMPKGERFLFKASSLASRSDIPLIFVDGNHEDHNQLPHDGEAMQELKPGISYLPRGVVITLGDSRVLGHGGAVSVDQAWRTENIDWFRSETADYVAMNRSLAAKNVDVVVAHDVPTGVELELTFPITETIEKHCIKHRDGMREILNAVEPKLWVAGHYHQRTTARVGNTTVKVLAHDIAPLDQSTLVEEL